MPFARDTREHLPHSCILTSLSETSITCYHAINSSIISVRARISEVRLYLFVCVYVKAREKERKRKGEIRFVEQSAVRWNCTNTGLVILELREREALASTVSIKVRINKNRVACTATFCAF